MCTPSSKLDTTSHEPSDIITTKSKDGCYLPMKRGCVLTIFMSTPCPPSRIPVKNSKSCGKVLTSKEQMKILEDKEKKQDIEREREDRREQREARKVREEKKDEGHRKRKSNTKERK